MSSTRVSQSIASLPARFDPGAGQDGSTRYRLRIGRYCRDVVFDAGECRVEGARGTPDVEIVTDPRTWTEIDTGRLSGIQAFAARRLYVRGSIEKSLYFEPSFDRPHAGGLRYSIQRFRTPGAEISSLVVGDDSAPPLLLLHGLGATGASWLPIVPDLARHYRVFALDLPGFGASSKPLGRYDPKWFSDRIAALIDVLGYDRVLLAGNSMGGKISMEVAMRHPDRIKAIACLCPAAAFSRRPAVWFVKLLRPELGILANTLPRKQIKAALRELFADPTRIDGGWYDAAIDDFLSIWRSPRARLAFFASLRHIYLEEPYGEQGFWSRLAQMEPPALFIYGRHDTLISPRFGEKVRMVLPRARVLVWDDCGHTPQLEWPERAAGEMIRFYGEFTASAEAV